MVNKIDDKNVVYDFNPTNEPQLVLQDGSEVIVETDDCFRSQLQDKEDNIDQLNWQQINPATGPIFIEGAQKGDILKVEIRDIEISDQAVMIAAPGEGVLGERIEEQTTKILPIKDNQVVFNESISLPLRPMIGVIGTAPEKGSIPNGTPDQHGGNMDCRRIRDGSTLYLPVDVEGALLSLGDLHAVMGDGEIIVCGAEARGKVTLKIEVLNNKDLPLPMVEDEKIISTIASAKTLDQAVKDATDNMADFLSSYHDLNFVEAGMLMSLIGDARICQVVDPQQTARFEIEKKYLNDLSVKEVLA